MKVLREGIEQTEEELRKLLAAESALSDKPRRVVKIKPDGRAKRKRKVKA